MKLLARDEELETFERAVEEVRDGASRTLVLVGEAGIGKSALLDWALDHAARVGTRTLSAAGTPAERNLPFAGLHQLLRPVLTEALLVALDAL